MQKKSESEANLEIKPLFHIAAINWKKSILSLVLFSGWNITWLVMLQLGFMAKILIL